MTRDDCGHIRHTTIADFNTVFISHLMESMVFRKMLRGQV